MICRTQQTVKILQENDYYAFGYGIQSMQVVAPSPKNEYLYNNKELQEETGLYDYGARFYDPIVARWTSVDPLAEKMRRFSPYNYVFDNPMRFTDPDGMEPEKIKAPHKDQQARILGYINSRSKTQYKFVNDFLEKDKKAKDNVKGSSKYSDKLNSAISSPKTIIAQIGDKFKEGSQVRSVDLDAGGGVTSTPQKQTVGPVVNQGLIPAGDPVVTISGNPNTSIRDNGKIIPDDPSLIFMHEMVGHAIPIIMGSTKGNAIDNENEIRKELNVPLRPFDPTHSESNFVH